MQYKDKYNNLNKKSAFVTKLEPLNMIDELIEKSKSFENFE